MAGQINNRELVKSICLSKTITLQVKSVLELSITAILNSLVILVARMALPSNLSEIIFFFFCIKQGHIISLIIPCSRFLVLFCFVFFLFISITYHVFKFPKRQTVSFPNSITYHPKSKTGKKIITLTHGKRLRNHVALIDKSEISCGSSSLKDLTPTTDRSC